MSSLLLHSRKSFILIFFYSLIFILAIYFVYYDILYNLANRKKENISQLTKTFPIVDPRKAAIILFKIQNEKDIITLNMLPHRVLNHLRNTLTDPRSFLVKSYGTQAGRPDFIKRK
uniref:Wsv136-like protein n=1 Tax=Metapenaeus joyneri majanivirus TaxID=2984280 RepID=A0A9C7BN17_9VIRU|nr:MAG: wsv136-like protein [Metapenaeus joyneri majanivirus]